MSEAYSDDSTTLEGAKDRKRDNTCRCRRLGLASSPDPSESNVLRSADGLHLAATCTDATDRRRCQGAGVKIAVIALPATSADIAPNFSHASE